MPLCRVTAALCLDIAATAETLTRLFTRYPELALTDAPIHWRDSTTFHGLHELPVRIT